MNIKTGIFSWYGFYQPYEKRLEYIKAAGFDGIMIWWEDEEGNWPVSRFAMTDIAKEMDLSIFNIHNGGFNDNNIWSEDESIRKAHIEPIKRTIAEIADCGHNNLVVHLCEKGDVPAPNKALLKSVEELIPIAAENHVTLSLENTWRADYLEAVWTEFPVKELGFCFDTSHANLRNDFYLLEKYSNLLSAYHISDNDGIEDRHWLPFDGIIDYEKVLPYFRNKDLPYTMELIADKEKYPDEMAFLHEAKKRINRFTAMI